jgi:hypothetical protein
MSESTSAHASGSTELLSTRRALLGDPLSTQVHEWLRPLYYGPIGPVRGKAKGEMAHVHQAVAGMVSALTPMLKSSSNLGAALQTVTGFIATPAESQYMAAFNKVKRANSGPVKVFLSVVYARALLLWVSSTLQGPQLVDDLKKTLANPEAAVRGYMAVHEKLDPGFVSCLIAYAEVEAQMDPHFARVLDRGMTMFLQHKPQGATDPVSDPKSDLSVLRTDSEAAWWRIPSALAFATAVQP